MQKADFEDKKNGLRQIISSSKLAWENILKASQEKWAHTLKVKEEMISALKRELTLQSHEWQKVIQKKDDSLASLLDEKKEMEANSNKLTRDLHAMREDRFMAVVVFPVPPF